MNKQTSQSGPPCVSSRIEYIDVLRVISMLSVVFLHTAAGSLRGNIGSPVWHFSNIFTSIMSTSVPIFFMISGAVLLSSNKTLSVQLTYKKRIPKILLPFLVWSIIAVIYYVATNFMASGSIDWKMIITKFRNLPAQPTTIHLWFMYALIPLYMLSPILKKLTDSLTGTLMLYLIALWLLFSSVLPTLVQFIPARYQSLFTLNASYNLNFMNGYLGYFLIGYFLMIYNKNISKRLLVGIIIADTAVITIGTWVKTIESGAYSELYKSYSRLFTLVLSIAVFLLAKELLTGHILPRLLSKLIQLLSSLSFGIYLVHNLVVDFAYRRLFFSPSPSIHMLILAYLTIGALSLIIIFILSSCKLTCFAFTGLSYKSACETANLKCLLGKLPHYIPKPKSKNF